MAQAAYRACYLDSATCSVANGLDSEGLTLRDSLNPDACLHHALSCYAQSVQREAQSPSLQGLTDSHFHTLAMADKGTDPVSATKKCKQAGMAEMIEIGLDPNDLAKRRALLNGIEGVYFSSGFSPAHAVNDNWRQRIDMLKAQAKSGAIAAIGELGLDWYRNHGTPASQIALMEAQLEIAGTARLPVIIHNRDADIETLNLLKTAALPAAGIMHCFSSDYSMAAKCIDLGYLISFAGNVTYKNADAIREAARKIPTEFLLVETDAPFLSPQPVRGKVNTPEYIRYTYDVIAELRETSVHEMAEQVRDNLRRFINSQE